MGESVHGGTFGQTSTSSCENSDDFGKEVSLQHDRLPSSSEEKRRRETSVDCQQGQRGQGAEGEEEGGGGLVQGAAADVGGAGLVLHCRTLEEAVKPGSPQNQSQPLQSSLHAHESHYQGDAGCSDLWDQREP